MLSKITFHPKTPVFSPHNQHVAKLGQSFPELGQFFFCLTLHLS